MLRSIFLLTFFAFSSVLSAGTIVLGETAPPLSIKSWIVNRPIPKDVNTRAIVVWAPWCPVSRLVLRHLDELQKKHESEGLQIIALTPELPSFTQRIVEQGGYETLWIGCDDDWKTFGAYMGALSLHSVPYAFLLKREGSEYHLWWHGHIVSSDESEPLKTFDETLFEVLDSSFDLKKAIKKEEQHRNLLELLQELKNLDSEGREFERIENTLKEFELTEKQKGLIATTCNNLAWPLVSAKDKIAQKAQLGLRIAKLAMSYGGDEQAHIVDTYARALLETGDIAGAIREQKKACKLDEKSESLKETLAQYEARLSGKKDGPKGPSVEKRQTDSPEQSAKVSAKETVFQGTVGSLWHDFNETEILLVTPSEFSRSVDKERWTTRVSFLKKRLFSKATHKLAKDVGEELCKSKPMVLYGTPKANPLVAKVLAHHGVELSSEGVQVGGTPLKAKGPILILALPNPWNSKLPVIIYTSYFEGDSIRLNSFFHGGNSFLLGRWEKGRPKILTALNFDYVQNEGEKAIPTIDTSEMAPGKFTTKEAIEDLTKLHENLHDNYGGYDDLEWKLRVNGSSWAKRLKEYKNKLEQKKEWSYSELFDLFANFLQDVQDTHFYMSGTSYDDGSVTTKGRRFVKGKSPYFTDLYVESSAGKAIVLTGPLDFKEAFGKEIKVKILPGPYEIVANEPYLFPTLPRAYKKKSYLLGVFKESNEELKVKVKIGGKDIELQLHRGRLGRGTNKGYPWSVSFPPKSILPLLEVRTNDRGKIGDVYKSAEKLRQQRDVVLDLRSNGGGGDRPAMDWALNFSRQKYQWVSGAQLRRGEENPLLRWSCWFGSTMENKEPNGPKSPFGGTLFVLTNRGIASSGETFTMLGSQVRGAIVVGENTAGCVGYGNCRREEGLPHSLIVLRYGHTKFVVDTIRHNPEGVGYFPDYWLDTEKPLEVIKEYVDRRVD